MMIYVLKKSKIIVAMLTSICMQAVISCCMIDEDPFSNQLTEYLKKDLPVVRVSSEKYAA